MFYWLHMQSNRRRFILWLCNTQGPNPRLHWCKIGRCYIFLTDLAEKAFLCSETIFASSAVYFYMQCQCTGCTDGHQAARKYEGASDKSIRWIFLFFFSPQQLFRKLGRKQWPGQKALWSDKIKKKCTSYKSTNQHQSSSVTRKNKLLPACLPSHIFLSVTRSRWDKAPSVLASSNAGVKASPSLKER